MTWFQRVLASLPRLSRRKTQPNWVKLSDLVVVPPDSPKHKRITVLLGIGKILQNRPEFVGCTLTRDQICRMLPEVELETVVTALDEVAKSGQMVDVRIGRDPRKFNFSSIPGGLKVELDMTPPNRPFLDPTNS